jgi:hypothetical protein
MAGVLAGEAGEGFGEYVVVMQSLQAWFVSDVQPETVDQVDVFGFQGWRVGADVEGIDLEIGPYNLEDELPLGLGHGFPGMAEVEGLLL